MASKGGDLTALKQKIMACAKPLQEKVGKLKSDNTVIGEVTVEQCIGGMRGIKGRLHDTYDGGQIVSQAVTHMCQLDHGIGDPKRGLGGGLEDSGIVAHMSSS